MKIGLLGDIHGNRYALDAVLTSARLFGIERLLITGDLIGYYFWPREVLELLTPWNFTAVYGNHESMLFKAERDGEYLELVDAKYGTGIRVALEELTIDQIQLLRELRHPVEVSVEGYRILVCHGSPWDLNLYIYPDSPKTIFDRCIATRFDCVVTGHTHHPMEKKLGDTMIVNPGSVGQTRNRNPGAYWAILDTESGTTSILCEPYDPQPVIEEAKRRHPELPYLAEVLSRS